MRLNRLDLIRFGRFSDAQIVFPKPTAGQSDVTIIYGPNEAGKSTAFTAYLELLFGMKARDHPYDYRFKRSDLLVGAEIDLPERGPITLQRNSKKTQSLTDAHGQTIDDAVLTGALHGLTRESYVERFSLNDDGLRQGGARIAGAQGDLGQLLHAGVSGLTSMSTALDRLSGFADQFHKKGGRTTALKAGKDRLSDIGQELRSVGLTPDRASKLVAAVEKAAAHFEAANQDLIQARSRAAACEAEQKWHDHSTDIDAIDAQLATFPDGPDLPDDASANVASLSTTILEKAGRADEARQQIEILERVIADNPTDPLSGAIAAALSDLDDLKIDDAPLMARALTAASDLDKRIATRDAINAEISVILQVLGADAPFVVTNSEIDTLAQAAQSVLVAKDVAETTRETLESAQGTMPPQPPAPQDLTELQAAWAKWQSVSDITFAQNTVAVETARLASAVATFPTQWRALIDAGLPARETISGLTQDAQRMTAALTTAQADLASRETDLQLAQASRNSDEANPAAIDAVASAQTRRQRNTKWATHRQSLSDTSADEFETAMFADDDAQAAFADGAATRIKLAASRKDEQTAQVLHDRALGNLNGLRSQNDAITSRCKEIAAQIGFAPETDPAAFMERHTGLVHAAEVAAQLANATSEFSLQQDRHLTARSILDTAARHVGILCADRALPAAVQSTILLAETVGRTWDQWKRDATQIDRLSEKADLALAHLDSAERDFNLCVTALPIPISDAHVALAALPNLRNLQAQMHEHAQLVKRVGELEDAIGRMHATAARISDISGISADDPVDVIHAARRRMSDAQEMTARREDVEKQRAAQTDILNSATLSMKAAQSFLDAIFEGQSQSDDIPITRAATLLKRDALRAQRKSHDTARHKARDGVHRDSFDAELALHPSIARAAEVQQLVDDADAARLAARVTHSDAQRQHREAFDAADPSGLITEQATLREELRNGARRAVVARLGVLAAKSALRRLATERRTTMLQDVERAFITITEPAWQGVDVWSKAEGEKLVGIQPDGNAVPVEQMSTGTMGQLYFALRVAGYRSFARDLGPLPMILDDIMETFDDDRAGAALRLCADIGQSGQAIMFTHHAHLVSLAHDTIAGVKIVEIPK